MQCCGELVNDDKQKPKMSPKLYAKDFSNPVELVLSQETIWN